MVYWLVLVVLMAWTLQKKGFISTFSVCSPVACRPSCVFCCCCCKCCGLVVVSVQSSYTSPSKCKCSSPSRNLVSCSLLTSYRCSLSCLSCGDVICGTSCLYSLSFPSCGDVVCGTSPVCLATRTTVGIADGSTLTLIILCALAYVLSRSLFTPEPEAPPSSTLFFLLRTLLDESAPTFFSFF